MAKPRLKIELGWHSQFSYTYMHNAGQRAAFR
jgi:hypothetical protein